MAVRFNADGQDYTRNLALGSVTQFSVTCWLKLSTDRNNYSTAWNIDNSGGDYSYLQTSSDGTTMAAYTNASSGVGSRALTVGTWYFWGFSVNGVNLTSVSWAVGDSAFTAATATDGDAAGQNAATLRLGESVFTGEWLNGCLAAFKLWTGVTLTQQELEAEAFQYLPARTNGLRAWYPLLQPQTTDYSGNGQTLSGGSGTTTEDGPPIRWGGGRTRIILPGDSVTGELAAGLPALGASAAGDVTASGQPSITLPALTGQATGQLTAAGQADAVLPALTGDLAGATTTPALLAATLPALTGSFEGELTGGFLTPVLPALTGQAAGQLLAHGELAASLPALTSDLAGHADIPHNNLDITVGAPYRGWASRPAATDWTADTSTPAWATRSPASGWGADTAERGWRTRQPTT